jgi:hypothetical protein
MRALPIGLAFLGLCAGALAVSDEDVYAQSAAKHVREALRQEQPMPWKKGASVVPNAEVATAIHAAVAGAVYGKALVEKERPFRAIRSGEFWVVFGSLPPSMDGGTAVTVIRADDGRIMRIIHEQ